MENIRISLAEVSECAGKIRHVNQQMYEQLSQMKKHMNELNEYWISDAGATIRNRFNQFAAKFESQKEVIESYARFLDQTVSSYDTLETTINSNASEMHS